MTGPSSHIEAQDVSKIFEIGGQTIYAVQNLTLKIVTGEFLVAMGPSGSGKTTLLFLLGALDQPSSGRILFEDCDLSQMTPGELAGIRAHRIGMIFQHYNLLPFLTALENVMVPMMFIQQPREERKRLAREKLELVDLSDRLNHHPSQLSGGQQQRVAIARALANNPSLILADEPTANLDLRTGLRIVELLRTINQETGITVVTATHDVRLISVADRIGWLRDGQVERLEPKIEVIVTKERLKAGYLVRN